MRILISTLLLLISACQETRNGRTIGRDPILVPTESPEPFIPPGDSSYVKGNPLSLIECVDSGSLYEKCRIVNSGASLVPNTKKVPTEFTVPYEFKCEGGTYRSEIYLTAGPVDKNFGTTMKEFLFYDASNTVKVVGAGDLNLEVNDAKIFESDVHRRGCYLLIDPSKIVSKSVAP